MIKMNEQENEMNEAFISKKDKLENRILKQTDLYEIFPFKKTKMQQLIKSGQLPLVKIGNDYITTFKIIEKWISDNIGEEIFY